jgi:leucyl aminopeptidase (aminopeptidase T)
MMERALKADYPAIARRTEQVTRILNKGKTARITTELGTDLTLPINGIQAISSTGLIREKGQGGICPAANPF